jgi:hypothetical protein
MSTGEGDAALERFYFDQGSKTCKPFIYRGLLFLAETHNKVVGFRIERKSGNLNFVRIPL